MTGEAYRPCCIYEAALEVLTVPVVVQDAERILYANARVCELLGCEDRAQIVGSPNTAFSLPESTDAEQERRRIVLERGGRLLEVPVRARSSDGSVRKALADASPIRFAGRSAILHTLRNVDNRAIAEYRPSRRERSDAEERSCMHEAAFDELSVPVVVQTASTLLAANRQARAVLGGSLEGRPIDDVLHPDFAQAAAERRAILLERGGSYQGAPGKLRTLAGRAVHGEFDGAVIAFSGTRAVVVTATRVRPA